MATVLSVRFRQDKIQFASGLSQSANHYLRCTSTLLQLLFCEQSSGTDFELSLHTALSHSHRPISYYWHTVEQDVKSQVINLSMFCA